MISTHLLRYSGYTQPQSKYLRRIACMCVLVSSPLMASNNNILHQPRNHTDFRLDTLAPRGQGTRSGLRLVPSPPSRRHVLGPSYDMVGPKHGGVVMAGDSQEKEAVQLSRGVSSVPYRPFRVFLVTTNPHAADRPRKAYRNSGHVIPSSVIFKKHTHRCCKCTGGSRRDRVPIYRRLMLSMGPSVHVLPVPIVYGPAGTRIALGDQHKLISSTLLLSAYLTSVVSLVPITPWSCSSSIQVRHAISVLKVTTPVTSLTLSSVDTSFV